MYMCTSASHAGNISKINNEIHISYVVALLTKSKIVTVLRQYTLSGSGLVNSMKFEDIMSAMAHKIPPDRQILRKNIYNLLFSFRLNLAWSMSHIDILNKFIKNFALDKYYRLK